jgi:hypothetical protein
MDVNSIKLPAIAGFEIRIWSRVPGRERVYVTLQRKSNGGQRWNGGIGRADYLDLATMRWHEATGWAGAATRDRYHQAVREAHEAVGTAVTAASARRCEEAVS